MCGHLLHDVDMSKMPVLKRLVKTFVLPSLNQLTDSGATWAEPWELLPSYFLRFYLYLFLYTAIQRTYQQTPPKGFNF